MAAGRRPSVSLSRRLVAGAAVWLMLILAVGGGALAWAFRDSVESEFSHRLDALLRSMIASMDTAPDGSVALVRPLGDPRFDQVYSGWYWQVTEPSGRQIRSRSLWDAVLGPGGTGTELHTRHAVGPKGEDMLVAERDLLFPGSGIPVHVQIAADLREVRDGVRRFDLLLMSALSLLGISLVVAILIQVRFGLRPLRLLAADLAAVREGDRPRLEGRYPEEVAPLAEAMNAVLDHDEELIERARTHVGNLAHGLKTPLAVLAAEGGGSPDPQLVRTQVQSMRRLIDHHLGRASAVAGAGRVMGVRTPVEEVANGMAAVLARIFADRHLTIDLQVAGGTTFRGHREDLEEILGNLMENACKWATGQVRLAANDDGCTLTIVVDDDGPGMTEEAAAEASQRGRRLDEAAPGWGLGLSIVTDLVEVNGGTISFHRSDLGGLSVKVRLPRRVLPSEIAKGKAASDPGEGRQPDK